MMDRLRQEEAINSLISKSKRIYLKPSSSSYNTTINENNFLMSSQMKRTISLPNKISNFFTPPSSSFNKSSNQHKITQKQSKINNNKYLINRLPKSQSQNEGFNFVDSPDSPNSSGYASLASSSAERCNLRLTGIEEEENQMNVSAAVSPHLTTNNKKEEINNLNTCCENKLFSPTTTTNFFQTNTSSSCQLNISTKNNFNNNNFFANKKKSKRKQIDNNLFLNRNEFLFN
uniref:Uncharacterized protein n=1 Tax=Meloidogyne enterolobii TaxID=390850 RepID=A0A6V7WAI7_MELEN|nr:unnamed protein product [Meloidogyne enterolobii]